MSDDDENAAYRRLEEAIEEVCRIEGFGGVPIEWVVIAASQRFEGDDSFTQVGTLLPDGGGRVPFHRVLGLVDYTHARLQAEAARDDT
ncbi:hypothetical protein [Streptomyces sp. NPDC058653]|uniref:hypothetical protein n=1 Tax=Streptomyces sp. NPDC058653 TaxID=3346576 RepID=UPI0036624949